MLKALCDGREDFVIVEDRGKRTEFVQFTREEDDEFYCEVAVDEDGGHDRKLLSTPHTLTLKDVNVFLDRFVSGEPLLPYLDGWTEENWQWREDVQPDNETRPVQEESFLWNESSKTVILFSVALAVLALFIILEWKRG